jgi:hypothetical protein
MGVFDDEVDVSGVLVCVDVAVFCREERRGCCSVEALGDEVLVRCSSAGMEGVQ